MNILIPQNFYAGLWALMLNDEHKSKLIIKPASLLNQEVENSDENDIFLLPSLSVYKNKDLFISKRFCMAFDGLLSNSYLYLREGIQTFDSILLRGDVSINEIFLSKILFLEKYDSEIEIKLDTSEKFDLEKNDYLIVGNENIEADFVNNGISFADEINTLLNYPYVDFILASKSKESLEEFHGSYEKLEERLEDEIDVLLQKMKLDEPVSDFIKMNLNSLYFELTENEISALNEMCRLPFYHGMTEDITDLKFI